MVADDDFTFGAEAFIGVEAGFEIGIGVLLKFAAEFDAGDCAKPKGDTAACFTCGTGGVKPVAPDGTGRAIQTAEPGPFTAGFALPGSGVDGVSGTEGKRSARMSAARAPLASDAGSRSSFFVITKTSSSRFNAALGLTVTCKNSGPFSILLTVPIIRPLGKI